MPSKMQQIIITITMVNRLALLSPQEIPLVGKILKRVIPRELKEEVLLIIREVMIQLSLYPNLLELF